MLIFWDLTPCIPLKGGLDGKGMWHECEEGKCVWDINEKARMKDTTGRTKTKVDGCLKL
jgi:hypothetical protein